MIPPDRYVPARPLPPYAYVPGRTPHPVTDPAGHSFGVREATPAFVPADRWLENEEYRYGADLFNAGFFWEAHEAWEGVWKSARGREDVQALFVQGLIQVAAALLKRTMGVEGGAQSLAHDGLEQLLGVAEAAGSPFMGLDLDAFLAAAPAVFAHPPGAVPLPRLELHA